MEMEPGMVLNAPPDTDLPGRTWVLLTDPTAPMALLCLAGEDADGDLCETDRTATVSREALARMEPLPCALLPWPKARVWAKD